MDSPDDAFTFFSKFATNEPLKPMIQVPNQNICDPRCPLCGRAVIGEKVQGMEGSYHPECTRPAPPLVPIPPSPFYPWADYPQYPPQPYVPNPTIICSNENPWLGNSCSPSGS